MTIKSLRNEVERKKLMNMMLYSNCNLMLNGISTQQMLFNLPGVTGSFPFKVLTQIYNLIILLPSEISVDPISFSVFQLNHISETGFLI